MPLDFDPKNYIKTIGNHFIQFIDPRSPRTLISPDHCSISFNAINIEMNDGEPIEIPERNSTLALTFNRLSSGQIPIYAYGTADGYANPFVQTFNEVRMVNASASEVEI